MFRRSSRSLETPRWHNPGYGKRTSKLAGATPPHVRDVCEVWRCASALAIIHAGGNTIRGAHVSERLGGRGTGVHAPGMQLDGPGEGMQEWLEAGHAPDMRVHAPGMQLDGPGESVQEWLEAGHAPDMRVHAPGMQLDGPGESVQEWLEAGHAPDMRVHAPGMQLDGPGGA
eukprot:1150199-Pelagomonas_calceolata.AAC.4